MITLFQLLLLPVIPPWKVISRQIIVNFGKEAELMSKLRHPNIALFMGIVVDSSFVGLVIEYCNHGSLYDVLHRLMKGRPIKLSWATRLRMLNDAARGMQYLHSSRILHRDLKSLNLLVTPSWEVKVADFGLSKLKEIPRSKHKVGSHVSVPASESDNNKQLVTLNGVGSAMWCAVEVFSGEPASTSALL